jgi:hypothetical protein
VDARAYRELCRRPDVMKRGVLEATARLTAKEDENAHRAVLAGEPLPKPPLHAGGDHTDYFRLELSLGEAEAIRDALAGAEVGAVGPEGESTPEASFAASLVDIWLEYIFFLQELRSRPPHQFN